jgi:hypothetical protein
VRGTGSSFRWMPAGIGCDIEDNGSKRRRIAEPRTESPCASASRSPTVSIFEVSSSRLASNDTTGVERWLPRGVAHSATGWPTQFGSLTTNSADASLGSETGSRHGIVGQASIRQCTQRWVPPQLQSLESSTSAAIGIRRSPMLLNSGYRSPTSPGTSTLVTEGSGAMMDGGGCASAVEVEPWCDGSRWQGQC